MATLTYVPGTDYKYLVATTFSGAYYSDDEGETWHYLGAANIDAISFVNRNTAWAISGGSILRFVGDIISLVSPQIINLDSHYLAPGIDTLKMTAKISNPFANKISVHAIIENSISSDSDTIPMFDDGTHEDNLPDDNIFGAIWPAGDDEDYYKIHINSRLDSIDINLFEAEKFTTIGPVEINDFYYTENDTSVNPGDRLSYILWLKNSSKDTLRNITVTPLSLDTICARAIIFRDLEFDNIAPGGIKQSNRSFTVIFDENCQAETDQFPFRPMDLAFLIKSNDQIYWYDAYQVIVSLGNESLFSNIKFSLSQNYPNPFNPATQLSYQIAKPTKVDLTIYDVTGREIETLVNKRQPPGSYTLNFDGADLHSGIYFYRLTTSAGFEQSRKMILLK